MSHSLDTIFTKYPLYEATIGIEVHIQLNTKSKIFCSCANKAAQEANSNICTICSGYPGSLPVLNKKVVDHALLLGLATNCTITQLSTFARKHYFYPDLPKGYQITQSDKPICQHGFVPIVLEDGSTKKIRLNRIHMEEDAGKNIHVSENNESFVDLNRAGTPLLEIVTEPDISSSYEARAYLKTLHTIVQYLGISTGNMEEGAFRADTNISVKKKTATHLGTKCELKNINSFKFISDAIEYELERQLKLIENGESVRQETRLWDTKNKKTIVMRSKEEAADYRYFQDPDLPLLEIQDEWINKIRTLLPELPHQKFERFIAQGLSAYQAEILVDDLELANYYEETQRYTSSTLTINWILRDIMGHLKEHKITVSECKVTPQKLATLVELIEKGKINNRAAQTVFEIVAQTGKEPVDVVKEQDLEQVDSIQELEDIVKSIINQNPTQVADYQAGKERLFGFFVGQTMQKTKGKGDPKIIQSLLKKYLHASQE